jgi:RHS repeat-associated protein
VADPQPEYNSSDFPRVNLPHPNEISAMRDYTELYEYDSVGNILRMIHQADKGDWIRRYDYETTNNRLRNTSLPGDPADLSSVSPRYLYDEHGSMTKMPHLSQMDWDFKDELQRVDLGGGGVAYYVYDAAGQRVRKVIERQTGARQKERIYLGGFEIYREYNGDGSTVTLERETLHVMDDQQRIALVETRTVGDDDSPEQLIRYEFGNHLGSASLELDEAGEIISYEEYYPYGSTSYQAVDKSIKAAAKRYRYTGMERDEETGLAYHGARYYVAWLGRWCSTDPIGIKAGLNVYRYASSRPILRIDNIGMADKDSELLQSNIQTEIFFLDDYILPNGEIDYQELLENHPDLVQEEIMPKLFVAMARMEIERTTSDPKVKYYDKENKVDRYEAGSYTGYHCTCLVYNSAYRAGYDVDKDFIKPAAEILKSLPSYEEKQYFSVQLLVPAKDGVNAREAESKIRPGDVIVMDKDVGGNSGHHRIISAIETEVPEVLPGITLIHAQAEFVGKVTVIEAGVHVREEKGVSIWQNVDSAIYRFQRIDWARINDSLSNDEDYRKLFTKIVFDYAIEQGKFIVDPRFSVSEDPLAAPQATPGTTTQPWQQLFEWLPSWP